MWPPNPPREHEAHRILIGVVARLSRSHTEHTPYYGSQSGFHNGECACKLLVGSDREWRLNSKFWPEVKHRG